jgi:hypothetical protein
MLTLNKRAACRMDLRWITASRQNMPVKVTDRIPTVREWVERRSKPRLYEPLPVIVHGVDANGDAFETGALIDNLSAEGLYMQLAKCIEPWATLSIIIRFPSAPTDGEVVPRVVCYGMVLRAEPKANGICGVAVAFTHHQFL